MLIILLKEKSSSEPKFKYNSEILFKFLKEKIDKINNLKTENFKISDAVNIYYPFLPESDQDEFCTYMGYNPQIFKKLNNDRTENTEKKKNEYNNKPKPKPKTEVKLPKDQPTLSFGKKA